MPEPVANDADTITKRIKEIRCNEGRRCYKKAGLATDNCWCIRAGENGASLPCTSAVDVG